MNLTELRAQVYTITNRPDLVDKTLTAVRSATLKLHHLDYFYRDLFETGIAFSTAAYLQQLNYTTLVPRWRALKYIRKTDVTGTQQGKIFDIITPEAVLDDYQLNREDVCYGAGSVIQIRSSTQFQYAMLGCYRDPDISELTFTSWVADSFPFAIIYEAASAVFKMIGDTEQFAAYTQLAAQEAALLRNSNILAQGY